MNKFFQKISLLIWRNLLTIIILTICTSVFLNNQNISILNSSILIAVFAILDFAKTKWIKIEVIQKEHVKTFFQFIWRHLLTLGVVYLIISVFIAGRIPGIEGTIIASMFAFFFDCFKGRKTSHESHESYDAYEQMMDYARRENDSHRTGSSAWMCNPAEAGSPANYLYNLGPTSSYNRY